MCPQSEAAHSVPLLELGEYSHEERSLLLELAHRSIKAALEQRAIDLTPPSPHLAEQRGAFTTLHLGGRLRGCIGYVFPSHSVYLTVAETARAAAFEDPRFEPVTLPETHLLKVELSILSPLRPTKAEDVVVGKHGLMVTCGGRRGLLLPQVPVQWDWDRETFLAQTCLKAGLPPDAWRQGAELQAFVAEVFGEE
jgi:uncharacterized protein